MDTTVPQCSCKARSCNGLESGAQLMAAAEGPATDLPAGVGIKCFQCTGEDDKCSDEDD